MYTKVEKEYNDSEKGQERRKLYEESEKGKEARKRYYQSETAREKRRERDRKYRQTKKGKAKSRRYNNSEKGKARDQRYWDKYPERRTARQAVFDAIRRGDLPVVSTQSCTCGAIAECYHHHKGYEKEHYLDVIPVCWLCHWKEHEK